MTTMEATCSPPRRPLRPLERTGDDLIGRRHRTALVKRLVATGRGPALRGRRRRRRAPRWRTRMSSRRFRAVSGQCCSRCPRPAPPGRRGRQSRHLAAREGIVRVGQARDTDLDVVHRVDDLEQRRPRPSWRSCPQRAEEMEEHVGDRRGRRKDEGDVIEPFEVPIDVEIGIGRAPDNVRRHGQMGTDVQPEQIREPSADSEGKGDPQRRPPNLRERMPAQTSMRRGAARRRDRSRWWSDSVKMQTFQVGRIDEL